MYKYSSLRKPVSCIESKRLFIDRICECKNDSSTLPIPKNGISNIQKQASILNGYAEVLTISNSNNQMSKQADASAMDGVNVFLFTSGFMCGTTIAIFVGVLYIKFKQARARNTRRSYRQRHISQQNGSLPIIRRNGPLTEPTSRAIILNAGIFFILIFSPNFIAHSIREWLTDISIFCYYQIRRFDAIWQQSSIFFYLAFPVKYGKLLSTLSFHDRSHLFILMILSLFVKLFPRKFF